MGLDMYLYERDKVTKEEREIGYWRKFNALHSFIANLKDKPDTNCDKLWLTKENINYIYETITTALDIMDADKPRVLVRLSGQDKLEEYDYDYIFPEETQDKVKEILAPCKGFFWGSDDVDMYYYVALKRSKEIFEKAKESKKKGNRVFYYSWW